MEFLSLGTEGIGVPVRATVSSFGPVLLSKVLGLNATQESTLGLIFHWAKDNRPLVTLGDLRSVISHLASDEGKADLKDLGGVSSTTAGVILRALAEPRCRGRGHVLRRAEARSTGSAARRRPGPRHHLAARVQRSVVAAGHLLHLPDVGPGRSVCGPARGR